MKTTKFNPEVRDELAVAEASAWLVRLKDATDATCQAAFSEWLDNDPVHVRAFARVTDIWEIIPGAVTHPNPTPVIHRHRSPARRRPWLYAAASVLLLLAGVSTLHRSTADFQVFQTAIGEQKTVRLADNSRITLNTDTRIIVRFSRRHRDVQLVHGEALFHVAENPTRPFVVQMGNELIEDLGTVFDASRYVERSAVTLLEGKVEVSVRGSQQSGSSQPIILKPGDRLAISAGDIWTLDHPDLQGVTAWQRGRIYFVGTRLSDAVAELNRYNNSHIRLANPALAQLRVSGVFSTHTPRQFALAVANLYGLQIEQEDKTIVLEH